MPKKSIYLLLFSSFLFLITQSLSAQSAEDVLRYSLEYPSYDPQSMIMPGASHNAGFGSFQENPAVMALFERSFGSFSASLRNVNEESTFNNDTFSFDDSQSGVGDFGLVYNIPTLRGSMVVGGGYSQTTDFNRALGINTRNNRSSLTEFYNITADDALYDAAFNVYALDYADVDSTFTSSIFRIGFGRDDWPGVQQNMELTERGKMGEYSAFFATEFQQNLFVGASIGVMTGDYRYERQFLESDPDNIYNGSLIDSDSDGTGDTDIDRVLSVDTINSEFTAFSARIGFLYQVEEFLRLGAGYEFPSTLSFNEDFNTRLSTTFDNGPGFEEELPGEFSYKIKRPGRFNLGASIHDLNGVSLSAGAEFVDYGVAELDLEGVDLAFQQAENDFIQDTFKNVINLKAGLEYRVNDSFTPRIGYAWYPSPRNNADVDRQFYNAGFTASFAENVWFDLGVQYATWEDQNQLYTFDTGTAIVPEVVNEDVKRLHLMAGIRIAFY
ncbi:MAG: outer membrane protein transport protein [Balneolaceae bacterium]|nr:outer membrane protein transport protein [Balneolaceae bacterium]